MIFNQLVGKSCHRELSAYLYGTRIPLILYNITQYTSLRKCELHVSIYTLDDSLLLFVFTAFILSYHLLC